MMNMRMKKAIGITAAVILGSLLVFKLISAVTGPSPSVMWQGKLPTDDPSGLVVNYTAFGSKDLVPLVAVIWQFQTNRPLSELSARLVTSELPHAVYLNDQMIRAERDTFVLYALTAGQKPRRVSIPVDAAQEFFRHKAGHTYEEAVLFWGQYVAPALE
jgi:hypothetical protein